ncbi:MAG: DUF1186 domain-containing protein [Thermodesulfobacteriota bacterium]
MTDEEIIQRLSRLTPHFPEEAMAAALSRQAEVTPLLLELLSQAADSQEEVAQQADNVGYIFAMYLLAQFRAEAALAPLIKFFATPGDLARQMTGDIITEGLGQLLAMVGGANGVTEIRTLVENEKTNPFVRGAALEGLLCLSAWDEVSPTETAAYLQELLSNRLERQPSHVWNYLAEAICQLCPAEVIPELEAAYDEGLISELYLGRAEALAALAHPLAERLVELEKNPGLAQLDDVAAEMRTWACYRPSEERIHRQEPAAAPVAPVTSSKVGRNEPCPCGSGKKFKRCCLGG